MKLVQVLKILLIAAIWGGSHVLVRMVVPTLGPSLTVFSRMVIAAFTLFLVLRARKENLNFRENRFHFLAVGFFNFALPMFLFSYAAIHLPATYLAILNATMPMFNAILSIWLLREPFGYKRAIGMLFGFSGVALLKEFGSVYVRKWAPKVNPLTLTTGSCFVASFLLMPLASYSIGTTALGVQLYDTWIITSAILILGVFGSGLAFVLFCVLIQEIGSIRTSSVVFLMPMFGMLWGYLFLQEEVTRGMIIGSLLVIGSTFLFLKSGKRTKAV